MTVCLAIPGSRTIRTVVPALLLILAAAIAPAQDEGHDDEGHGDEATHEVEATETVHRDEIQLSAVEQAEFGLELATAGPGVITTVATLPGEIRPNDDRLAHLVPRYEGIVTEVHAREGDRVRKGQVLAVIESNETLVPYPLKTLIDGTVIAKHITLGEAASPDRAPYVVADLSTVWLYLSVYQRDLDLIRPGQRVLVRAEGEAPAAEGRVTYVTPIVEETTRTASARVVLDNAAGRWRPGMFVVGDVEVASREVAVAVPGTALFTVHDETVVFVRDEHGFEARHVETGATGRARVEIVAGLQVGDRYVSRGGFTLKAELEKASFGHGHAH